MATKKFAVKCIFQLTYQDSKGTTLSKTSWAERIFLIKAKDIAESYLLAEEAAAEYECTYTNYANQIVTCTLYELSDSSEIFESRMQNGTSLYCNYFDATTEEVEAILRTQHGEKNPPFDMTS